MLHEFYVQPQDLKLRAIRARLQIWKPSELQKHRVSGVVLYLFEYNQKEFEKNKIVMVGLGGLQLLCWALVGVVVLALKYLPRLSSDIPCTEIQRYASAATPNICSAPRFMPDSAQGVPEAGGKGLISRSLVRVCCLQGM